MRVAIFTNNYLPNPFGVSSSIESFRKEFEKAGHTVYVFAPEAKGYADENRNVFRYPAIDLKFRGIRFPIAIPYSRKIDRILDKLEIDIFHSQHPNLLGSVARKWAKKKNVPLVFTWHTLYDKYTHFAPSFIPGKIATWWVISNAVNYANKADAVVVPTASVEKIIRKWGVRNKNIVPVMTGVEDEIFKNADGVKIRNKHRIGQEKIVLTLVSRFTEEKNIRFLFEAVADFLKNRNDVVFLAKGIGNLLEEMKEYVAQEKIEKKVVFANDTDQRGDVFLAGDIFVYASKSETQGMVISEAMYCGLPIVAVRATGVEDLVMDGTSGMLVSENKQEFFQALKKLANDMELRKRFSENAKKITQENYTASICAGKMLEVYENTIKRKAV